MFAWCACIRSALVIAGDRAPSAQPSAAKVAPAGANGSVETDQRRIGNADRHPRT